MRKDYDVIVVGGGGSGLAAAVSAAQAGAQVLLLEKTAQLAGTTGIAVGSFTASGTRMQRKARIDDCPANHADDAGRFAPAAIEACNHPDLRRFFLDHASETLDWLEGMGLSFYGPNPEPPNRVPRMHNVVPNAKAYIATLQARLLRSGGTILANTPVTELLLEGGRVTGVVAKTDGQTLRLHAARGVVLATGDYSNSSKLIAQHKGPEFGAIEGINEMATGDGHLLAEQVGAKLLNMHVTYGPELRFIPTSGLSFTQLLPASGVLARAMGWVLPWVPKFIIHTIIKRLLVTWQHPENALLADGAILVNSAGQRFCNETIGPQREIAIARQPGKICYILLDERLITRYSAWPHFISTAPEIAYAYVADYLRLRPDVAVAADDLAGLARRRSLPQKTLQQTVADFNRYAAGQSPDRFGRTDDRHPLAGQRWVLLGPAKAYFTTTEGGAAINEKFQVLDASDKPIPGLYAVGQIGLGGQILWGHGLHIGWALTSGRLAGKIVADSR
jgi:fumarate reductase flavoprotein subunit